MADGHENNEIMKMKVADLKRELKARGLSTVGNKTELIDRLQMNLEVIPGSRNIDEINSSMDDIMDDSTNNEEADLLAEDDDLEDGLDDEMSVEGEGISESNVPIGSVIASVEAVEKIEVEIEKKITPKRKLITSAARKEHPANQQAKKLVLNRNTLVTKNVSEKENEETSDKVAEVEQPVENTDETAGPSRKVIKLSGLSMKDRLEMRAQKFGGGQAVGPALAVDDKKVARAIRFGISTPTSFSVPATSAELLKKRAERFGVAVSPLLKKTELEEKLKSREKRFGVISTTTRSSLAEKRKQRAERFQLTV